MLPSSISRISHALKAKAPQNSRQGLTALYSLSRNYATGKDKDSDDTNKADPESAKTDPDSAKPILDGYYKTTVAQMKKQLKKKKCAEEPVDNSGIKFQPEKEAERRRIYNLPPKRYEDMDIQAYLQYCRQLWNPDIFPRDPNIVHGNHCNTTAPCVCDCDWIVDLPLNMDRVLRMQRKYDYLDLKNYLIHCLQVWNPEVYGEPGENNLIEDPPKINPGHRVLTDEPCPSYLTDLTAQDMAIAKLYSPLDVDYFSWRCLEYFNPEIFQRSFYSVDKTFKGLDPFPTSTEIFIAKPRSSSQVRPKPVLPLPPDVHCSDEQLLNHLWECLEAWDPEMCWHLKIVAGLDKCCPSAEVPAIPDEVMKALHSQTTYVVADVEAFLNNCLKVRQQENQRKEIECCLAGLKENEKTCQQVMINQDVRPIEQMVIVDTPRPHFSGTTSKNLSPIFAEVKSETIFKEAKAKQSRSSNAISKSGQRNICSSASHSALLVALQKTATGPQFSTSSHLLTSKDGHSSSSKKIKDMIFKMITPSEKLKEKAKIIAKGEKGLKEKAVLKSKEELKAETKASPVDTTRIGQASSSEKLVAKKGSLSALKFEEPELIKEFETQAKSFPYSAKSQLFKVKPSAAKPPQEKPLNIESKLVEEQQKKSELEAKLLAEQQAKSELEIKRIAEKQAKSVLNQIKSDLRENADKKAEKEKLLKEFLKANDDLNAAKNSQTDDSKNPFQTAKPFEIKTDGKLDKKDLNLRTIENKFKMEPNKKAETKTIISESLKTDKKESNVKPIENKLKVEPNKKAETKIAESLKTDKKESYVKPVENKFKMEPNKKAETKTIIPESLKIDKKESNLKPSENKFKLGPNKNVETKTFFPESLKKQEPNLKPIENKFKREPNKSVQTKTFNPESLKKQEPNLKPIENEIKLEPNKNFETKTFNQESLKIDSIIKRTKTTSRRESIQSDDPSLESLENELIREAFDMKMNEKLPTKAFELKSSSRRPSQIKTAKNKSGTSVSATKSSSANVTKPTQNKVNKKDSQTNFVRTGVPTTHKKKFHTESNQTRITEPVRLKPQSKPATDNQTKKVEDEFLTTTLPKNFESSSSNSLKIEYKSDLSSTKPNEQKLDEMLTNSQRLLDAQEKNVEEEEIDDCTCDDAAYDPPKPFGRVVKDVSTEPETPHKKRKPSPLLDWSPQTPEELREKSKNNVRGVDKNKNKDS